MLSGHAWVDEPGGLSCSGGGVMSFTLFSAVCWSSWRWGEMVRLCTCSGIRIQPPAPPEEQAQTGSGAANRGYMWFMAPPQTQPVASLFPRYCLSSVADTRNPRIQPYPAASSCLDQRVAVTQHCAACSKGRAPSVLPD